MVSNLQPGPRDVDRNVRVCFIAGLLTLLAVCTAIVPVPFTGYVCFPVAAILAVVASVHGAKALLRFRALTTIEKGMAMTGMAAGIAGFSAVACSAVLTVVLGLRLIDALGQLGQ
jgi:hypothetical protein